MTTALTQKVPATGKPAETLAEIAPLLAPLLERVAADPNARVALLEQLLGVNACRQIGIYPIPPGFKLSVVIPVYNEERWLGELVRRVQAVEIPKELILVNDFSTDGTPAILAQLEKQYDNVRVFHQPKNMGKGAALREGFKHCTGDLVVVQDADWEYDPAEYPKLIQPILDGRADVVIGSRFIGESHRVLYYWHSVGNKVLTTLSNWCTNLNLTDMETCYKVFKREVIQGMTLKSNRFGFEPEVTAKIARKRKGQPPWRIYEVPISYSGRTYEEGKKIGMKDGFQALYCIIRYWLAD
ncbi:glycosyltransferase family 2 protein [Gemmata sp. G18]|uniref:Glycosyltransferase family 2 protein n=1 Tax=Gemmata palustris TaxID=2822762 RepID=A0ABS5C035_9BACT|nr:glycosyltransferase family 2 protein [Gemmata palustris]MBP3959356.1 glycosyltransferase family 2 protein [Gemmata palustris]